MSSFTEAELRYLQSGPRLARIATVGADGTPHVVPTGWSYNAECDSIDVAGHNLTQTKKYRDVARTGRAAVVIDDVVAPWQPRSVEVRGRAEAIDRPAPFIRIHPDRVVSKGLESEVGDSHSSGDR
jgi:pyridoxamine 5'-phosphate oxidase family protein